MSIREHSVAIIQQSIALLALLDYVENAAARPTCLERARAWLAWANPFRRHGGQLSSAETATNGLITETSIGGRWA